MATGITTGSPRLRVRTGVTAIVLGLVAVSVGTPYAAASSPQPGAGGSGIAWGNCDPPRAGLQCATVSVPLDWNDPNGQQINLAVIRHPASKPQQRIETLFVNPGGPGLSGVDFVRGVFDQTTILDDWGKGRFDVVSWDPRGTHRGSPVECFTSDQAADRFWAGVSIPTTRAESTAYQQKGRRVGAPLR
jgi:hypothetical protein